VQSIHQTIMNRSLGKPGASMYGRLSRLIHRHGDTHVRHERKFPTSPPSLTSW
jgi:hypothetical protein